MLSLNGHVFYQWSFFSLFSFSLELEWEAFHHIFSHLNLSLSSLVWLGASIVMFLFPFLQKWFGQFGLMMILNWLNDLNLIIGVLFVENYNDKKDQIKTRDDIKQVLINGEQGEVNKNTSSNLL